MLQVNPEFVPSFVSVPVSDTVWPVNTLCAAFGETVTPIGFTVAATEALLVASATEVTLMVAVQAEASAVGAV